MVGEQAESFALQMSVCSLRAGLVSQDSEMLTDTLCNWKDIASYTFYIGYQPPNIGL